LGNGLQTFIHFPLNFVSENFEIEENKDAFVHCFLVFVLKSLVKLFNGLLQQLPFNVLHLYQYLLDLRHIFDFLDQHRFLQRAKNYGLSFPKIIGQRHIVQYLVSIEIIEVRHLLKVAVAFLHILYYFFRLLNVHKPVDLLQLLIDVAQYTCLYRFDNVFNFLELVLFGDQDVMNLQNIIAHLYDIVLRFELVV